MFVYTYAWNVNSCKDHLKRNILPLLEEFILNIDHACDVSGAFKAILTIGPSETFISSLCKEHWIFNFLNVVDPNGIAGIAALASKNDLATFTQQISNYAQTSKNCARILKFLKKV